MRNLKKLFAIGLSTVMLMSSSIMAFAGNTDFSGNVGTSKTISGWQAEDSNLFEVSDVAIQTGSAADEWEMTSGETGKATFVNTTEKTTLKVSLQGGASLNGVTVKVYQLLNITGQTETGYTYSLANEALRPFFKTYFSLGTDDDASIITAIDALSTNDELVAFTNSLQQYIADNGITAVDTYTASTDETEHIFDISRQYEYSYVDGTVENDTHVYSKGKGYYFVTRDDAIDSTYTLRVLDAPENPLTLKGTKLSLDKSGDKVVMKVGETVNYTLESKMVNTNGDTNYGYIMYDSLEDTMEADLSSIVVTLSTTDAVPVVTTLVKDTDYTVEETTVNHGGSDVNVIAIKFKFDAASKLYNDAHLGEIVKVTYTAKMTKTATSGNDKLQGYENYNKAWLVYGGNETNEDEWDVYTVAMKITKKDEADNLLKDAQFNLFDSTDTSKTTPLKFSRHTDGYYYYDAAGSALLVTDVNGVIDIRGLDKSSYILSEVKAPTGYQEVDDQIITVTVTEDLGQDEFTALTAETNKTEYTTVSATVSDGYINLTIKDPTEGSADLPATGGVGRIFIYVIGSLILIGGCAAFVITRKKSA